MVEYRLHRLCCPGCGVATRADLPPGVPGGAFGPRLPHEYLRDLTATALTLFHPADGNVRMEGVTACPNTVPHPCLKHGLTAVPGTLLTPSPEPAAGCRPAWKRWQEDLTIKPTLASELPPLPMLPVLNHLAGHKTPEFVCWLFTHGILPL